MFTPKRPIRSMIGWIERSLPIATITSGGSSEMPVNELTVVPHGCGPSDPSSTVVTTVTPVANLVRTSRYDCWSMPCASALWRFAIVDDSAISK
jgi:hypothetical protein